MIYSIVIFATCLAGINSMEFSTATEELLEDVDFWLCQQDPQGWNCGKYKYILASEYPSWTIAGFKKQIEVAKVFKERTKKLMKRENDIGEKDPLYLRVLLSKLNQILRGMDHKGYLIAPIGHYKFFGVDIGPDGITIKSKEDVKHYFNKLRKIPTFIKQMKSLLVMGVEQNTTMARVPVELAEPMWEKLLGDPEKTEMYEPLSKIDNMTTSISSEELDILKSKAVQCIKVDLQPALRDLKEYIYTEYIQHARADPQGMLSNAGGRERYDSCAKFETDQDEFGAEEIHKIGLENVKLLREGLVVAAQKAGLTPNLSPKEYLELISNQPSQTYKSEEELAEHFNYLMTEKVLPQGPNMFFDEFLGPKMSNFQIKQMDGIIGRYLSGDNYSTGTFGVDYKFLKRYQLLALSLHEVIPGHHVQFQVFPYYAKPTTPISSLGVSIGPPTSCPQGIPTYNGAFAEGWALYSEFLGLELGLYDNVEDLMGFYSWNLLRAVRLVVDTGLHYYGWSREKTADYIYNNTGFDRIISMQQTDRYLAMPGQALSYKLGELQIRRLREELKQLMGDKFDLRHFHSDVLLCGALSMRVLRECVLSEICRKVNFCV